MRGRERDDPVVGERPQVARRLVRAQRLDRRRHALAVVRDDDVAAVIQSEDEDPFVALLLEPEAAHRFRQRRGESVGEDELARRRVEPEVEFEDIVQSPTTDFEDFTGRLVLIEFFAYW